MKGIEGGYSAFCHTTCCNISVVQYNKMFVILNTAYTEVLLCK